MYKLICPKCEMEDSVICEITNARLDYNVRVLLDGSIDFYNEEMYEAEETFYCSHCNYLTKNINEFITEE